MITMLSPTQWEDYELIDCGNFEKLERFGKYITIRPEPQAIWDPALSIKEWDKLAHVGVFPEQAANWDYAAKAIKAMKITAPKVLNLFAYTGGASLAARSAGAEVTHVDSIKQVVTWANENQELSNLKDIKWVVEDALKFVKREVKRGKKYNGIILDPPAFGHGPNGEKWKLEDSINEIMKDVAQLADPDNFFLILNTYSLGFSSLIVENLIKSSFKRTDNLTIGELYLQASKGAKLPLGVFGKIQYIK